MSVSKVHCFMCDRIENISTTAITTDVDRIEDDGFITVYPSVISFCGKAEDNQSPEYTMPDSRQDRLAAEYGEQDVNN